MSVFKFATYAALAAAVASPLNALASTPATTTAATQASATDLTDQRIHDYIMSNPKVIIDSLQKYQRDMQQKAQEERIKTGLGLVDELRTPSYDTVVGNPNGSVTMVEFFDYQCIMCYRVYKDIEKIMANNKDLRVVFRLLPIFGKASAYAAKVDVAAALQGKYQTFHHLMFKAKRLEGKMKDSDVRSIAKKAGVNLSKSVMKEVEGEHAKAYLTENLSLAKKMRINGTPAFVIMPSKGKVSKDKFFMMNGAVPAKYLQMAIDTASGKKPKADDATSTEDKS